MEGKLITQTENIQKKKKSKYGFERMNVGDALEFRGKTQNQVIAAAQTLVKYHNKTNGIMANWKFECFQSEKSNPNKLIVIIKRIA